MDIHLTKKDFIIEWFSGTGAGGQHRNKHQNCCRIKHIESGLVGSGQDARDRITNQRNAFNRLAKKIISYYSVPKERRLNNDVIRTYHAERNEVIDKASGYRKSYKDVVINADIAGMITARARAMINK